MYIIKSLQSRCGNETVHCLHFHHFYIKNVSWSIDMIYILKQFRLRTKGVLKLSTSHCLHFHHFYIKNVSWSIDMIYILKQFRLRTKGVLKLSTSHCLHFHHFYIKNVSWSIDMIYRIYCNKRPPYNKRPSPISALFDTKIII